eukprot:TRINITY_DN31290_c0_g1_i1.p2 TRINITY_DN31290_c0_g1~~TRINITY_DN31290_c0_g1_i1.p2  ORF type:complete len:152 (-),score=33.00 TRINITY_DN31290_c0_g1_i1:11-466(-)
MTGGSVAALFILNRNGSLIYEQDFQGALPQLSSNDKIRLSSTFHGISAIASQISPVQRPETSGTSMEFLQPNGIVALDADTFRLQCFHAPTGLKFFVVMLPPFHDCEALLRQTYAIYSDCVLKNPFYELDMPVRFQAFDQEIRRLFVGSAP